MLWDMSCKLPERSRSIAALEKWQRTSIRYTTMVEISPTAVVLQPWEAKCVDTCAIYASIMGQWVSCLGCFDMH